MKTISCEIENNNIKYQLIYRCRNCDNTFTKDIDGSSTLNITLYNLTLCNCQDNFGVFNVPNITGVTGVAELIGYKTIKE